MNKCKGYSKSWFLALLLVIVMAGCATNGGDPGTLVSIKVTPATTSIPVTGTLQYVALAIYGDGSSRDVTVASTWSAGTAGVTFGLIKGLATGAIANVVPVVITATYSGKTTTAALTVNAATSMGLTVTPATASIPVTGTQKYTAIEIFSDGTSFDRTTNAATTWTTSNANASLSPSGVVGAGLATGVTANVVPVVITATFGVGGPSATASLTVNSATSKGLLVMPPVASIPVTGTQQYTALEVFSDGSTVDRTTNAATIWTKSNANINLSPNGVVGAGLATGVTANVAPVVITATYGVGGPSGTANLTVTAATSMGLTVTPAIASIAVTGTQKYTAIETFSDGSTIDRTTNPATTWTASSLNATLSPSGVIGAGLATGVSATPVGVPVVITATFGVGGPSATANLTVTSATSTGIVVTPATPSIPVAGTQQFVALETFSDGSTIDRTANPATIWTASNANASLSPNGILGAGLATGVTATPVGLPVVITATYGVGGPSGTANLTVTAATLMAFKVTPATALIAITGGTQQFSAFETLSDGSIVDRTTACNWTSANLPLGGAVVSTIGLNTGIATGNSIGQSTITATFGLKTASAVLTVTAPNPGAAGSGADLGMAATYGIIATNAITSSSVNSHIYGDVALTTGVISSVTGPGYKDGGVAPNLTSSGVTTSDGVTPGIINTADNGNLSVAQMTQLQTDLNAAYIDLSGRPAGTVYPAGAKELSGLVLLPGVYQVGASAASDTYELSTVNGPLVLDAAGNPDAVFIFKAGTITTTTGSVLLQGGAQPKNIFWVVSADATIGNGTSTFFQGTIVAGNTITVGLNTNVQGRMLAGALGAGSITNSGVITVPK